jgi:predicted ribosome quality control (RQC) complex YloA/Tae2 family protein
MEISASEIRLLCNKISASIEGYSVSSVYSIEEGILLRLRHELKEEKFVAISSFATWQTTKNVSLEQADSFVTSIRDCVERTRLLNVKQEGTERIATFLLESRSGKKTSIHAEFFAGGNIAITDEQERIQFVRNPRRFRHRNLIAGERYTLPPSRGMSIETLDKSYLSSELEKAKADQKLGNMDAIRWFGRIVGTSRKFVEEIFFRAEVDPKLPIDKLGSPELGRLVKISSELVKEIESSSKGFLLIPETQGSDDNNQIEIDACPIIPHSWIETQKQNIATIREFESFAQALDEALVHSFLLEKQTKASKEVRSKADELDSAIRKQDILFQKNAEKAKELRRIGSELIANSSSLDIFLERISNLLITLEIVEEDPNSNNELRFVNEPRTFVKSFETPPALASRLFDEAKRLERTNQSISEIRANLVKKKDSLLEQSRASEDRATRRVQTQRRARQWFERYRWFLTSDKRLAIGGRDSTSNSIVINKYTDENSIVFHADLHGSPFFVLRDGRENGVAKLDQPIEQELAQATVSFSRAWKDELGSADAYWVESNQIKKSAPSGEYLPRGSFFIEGKKNFVRHQKVELCVGIMSSEDLPKETEETAYSGQTPNAFSPVVVCGPEKALAKYCLSRIRIVPGKERGIVAARRIKQILISKIKLKEDGEVDSKSVLKELSKRIPIDDIIRVLPSGSYKIVSEKQNG